jgi:hypothetical protein
MKLDKHKHNKRDSMKLTLSGYREGVEIKYETR